MIDIGANLTDSAFDGDRQEVIDRALAAGVTHIVLTGTSVKSSKAAIALCESRPGILYSTAGVHPHDASSFGAGTRAELAEFAKKDCVVAIGECGLDFNRDFSPRDAQRSAFETQIELACELGKPLFVHERDAADDLLTILDRFSDDLPEVVVHCFTGVAETLAEYLRRDFYIGITGWICDERRGLHLLDLIKEIPSTRLMIETDAPYLLPRTIRPRPKSRRNEPAFLSHVATTVAEAAGKDIDVLTAETSTTSLGFFGLS